MFKLGLAIVTTCVSDWPEPTNKKVKKAKKKSRSRSPIPLPTVAEDHEDHENEGSKSPGSSRSRSASIEEGELSEEELEQKRMALFKQLEATSNDWKYDDIVIDEFVFWKPFICTILNLQLDLDKYFQAPPLFRYSTYTSQYHFCPYLG